MLVMTNISKLLPLVLLAGAAGAGGAMLEQALQTPTPTARADRAASVAPEIADLVRRVSTLEARIVSAETGPQRDGGAVQEAVGTSGRSGGRVAVTEGDAEPQSAPQAPPDDATGDADPLRGILGRTYGYVQSRQLFTRLSRSHQAIGDVIARLEAEIEKNPQSADLHAALATAYAAKTAYATPPGPDQGVVWAKAEEAYNEAIRIDPEHWEARYGQAFGDSMAPEFVGLRPRAIREFEELMEIQERKPLAPEHAEVYVRLGTLYKDAGNTKKARETWRRGLDRFPEETRLTEALALVEEK